jgi:hypothetical protein
MSRLPILALGCLFAGRAAAASLDAPTFFDATSATVPREGAVTLAPGDAYEAGRGYGWTQAPAATFAEASWSGVRSPALGDGVSGGGFALRVDLASGRWTARVSRRRLS